MTRKGEGDKPAANGRTNEQPVRNGGRACLARPVQLISQSCTLIAHAKNEQFNVVLGVSQAGYNEVLQSIRHGCCRIREQAAPRSSGTVLPGSSRSRYVFACIFHLGLALALRIGLPTVEETQIAQLAPRFPDN